MYSGFIETSQIWSYCYTSELLKCFVTLRSRQRKEILKRCHQVNAVIRSHRASGLQSPGSFLCKFAENVGGKEYY